MALQSSLFHSSDQPLPEDYDPNQEEKLELWRSEINSLHWGKISWEQFLKDIPLSSHPARFLSTTKAGYSILHLAVLSDRLDLVERIMNALPQLKWKRSHLGWTPLELARFLPREKIIHLLQYVPESSFVNQPNVQIPDCRNIELFSNLVYLSQPLFESQTLFDEIVAKTQIAKTEDAISPERIWMGIYFDIEIQTGAHPKVSIRFIDNEVGFGVFAEQRVPSCAFAGEYRGIVKAKKSKELKNKVHCVKYTGWAMGRKNFVIDAETMGNYTRFINHSDKPNLSLQSVYWRGIPRLIFVALKEISEGTQLTFDYGTIFWKECCQKPILFE